MSIKRAGLFCFATDFSDEGVDETIAYLRDLGITQLTLASVYHAGFFIYPHNPRMKVCMLEDGVTYFHPTASCYANSPIKPTIASVCKDTDWFARTCQSAQAAGMEITAWTVCLHNSRIGLLHPEATIHNVFGDSYPHALTPAHPLAIAYVQATVADLAEHYPLHSIFLEAPDYRRRKHGGDWVAGHHHERNGVHLRDLEEQLLDLSFNPVDVRSAQQAGVDVQAVRKAVANHLQRYMDAAPEIPGNLPRTIDEFRQSVPALIDLEAHYRCVEAALLKVLKETVESHGVRLMGGPGDPAIDTVLVGAYGEPVDRTTEILQKAKGQLLPGQELAGALRMGFNSPGMGTAIESAQHMSEYAKALDTVGLDAIYFYNYSESPRRPIEWIKPALRSIGFTGLASS